MEHGSFEKRGFELDWTTFTGGTGQMTKALRNGDIDACVLLTEGVIADIFRGNPSRIISIYVTTPLCWGIHTGQSNELKNYSDIFDKKYAISRFGSGSHLMAIVDANSKGEKIRKEQFSIIKDLEGALAALDNQETDVFYWEKYTTKPYVDSGKLRRIGEYLTPWPCFVIAATEEILKRDPENIIRMLRVIHDSCDRFMRESTVSIPMVSKRYDQQLPDVERWFHSTEWAIHGWISDKMISNVIYNLKLAGIMDKAAESPELIWKR